MSPGVLSTVPSQVVAQTMSDSEERITNVRPDDLPAAVRQLSEEPVFPVHYWGRITALILVAGFTMVMVLTSALKKETAAAIVGLAMVGFLGVLLNLCMSKHTAMVDSGRRLVLHGQRGFRCRHLFEDILALQIVRAPPRERQKFVRYQLILVSANRTQPRCFLTDDADYLTLAKKAREWAKAIDVPVLDRAGPEALPQLPLPSRGSNEFAPEASAAVRGGMPPLSGNGVLEPAPDLEVEPIVLSGSRQLISKFVWWLIIMVSAIWSVVNRDDPSTWYVIGALVGFLLLPIAYALLTRPRILVATRMLLFGFPGFKKQRAIRGLQLLIVEEYREMCELNVVIDEPQRPRVNFWAGQGLAGARSLARNLADFLKAPVWEQRAPGGDAAAATP